MQNFTHVYEREDGMLECYNVEPTVLTKDEYEAVKYKEERATRRAQLMAELEAIDNEIANEEVESPKTADPEEKVVAESPEVKAETPVTPTRPKRLW